MSFEQAIDDACCYLNDSHAPVGIELDVDAISFMPASAYTNVGVDVSDAQFYVHTIAQLPQSCYLTSRGRRPLPTSLRDLMLALAM